MPRLVAAGAIAAAALIGAPGASAAITIGGDFTGLSANSSNTGDTGSPATLPSAGLVASPMDGVVVRWRAGWSSSTGAGRVRVVTPLSGPFLFKSASAIETDFSGGVGEFATRIPIRAGDRIAVDDMGEGNPVVRTDVPGASYDWWGTVPPDKASLPPNGNLAGMLFLNADVEADADVDGFGDETQDQCPGVSGASGGCPPAVSPTIAPTKKKRKCKKRKAKRRGAVEAKKKCKKRK
jgi:hypothetical protein